MTVVHCTYQPYTHYIGRPSIFGNRFIVRGRMSRVSTVRGKPIQQVDSNDEAIYRFEIEARGDPALLADIRNLPESASLGCFCNPRPCHGNVIIKLWKEMHDFSPHLEIPPA